MRKPTKNWIDMECLFCKKDYKTYPCYIKRGTGKYCSRLCAFKDNLGSITDSKKENNGNWKGGISFNNYHYKIIQAQRYPEKIKARDKVRYAKKSGKLIPKPCEKCQDIKVCAHHDNYSKPLDVRWLCRKCHHNEHYQIKILSQ